MQHHSFRLCMSSDIRGDDYRRQQTDAEMALSDARHHATGLIQSIDQLNVAVMLGEEMPGRVGHGDDKLRTARDLLARLLTDAGGES